MWIHIKQFNFKRGCSIWSKSRNSFIWTFCSCHFTVCLIESSPLCFSHLSQDSSPMRFALFGRFPLGLSYSIFRLLCRRLLFTSARNPYFCTCYMNAGLHDRRLWQRTMPIFCFCSTFSLVSRIWELSQAVPLGLMYHSRCISELVYFSSSMS